MTDEKQNPGFFSKENLKSLGILILIVFAIRWSIASPYHVPTASMEPSIKVGDRLIANKLAYGLKLPFTDWDIVSWGTPKKGDIVVFKYPKDTSLDYVKRVVGVAGDRIRIRDNILYVNDEPQDLVEYNHDREILTDIVDEPDTKNLFKETLNGNEHWVIMKKPAFKVIDISNWPPIGSPDHVVSEDSIFCVGDNRDNSRDSRSWGEVPLSFVRGRASFVLWSMYKPQGEWFKLRFDRFGYQLH